MTPSDPAAPLAPPPLVVHVVHRLALGGMENTLVNLINRMPASALRHAVVCIEDFSDFRARIVRSDVEVVALHRSRVGVTAVRHAIWALCRRWRPAVLHSRNLSGLDALAPAWLARVPARVHSEHGLDVDNLQGKAWRPLLLRRLHRPLVSRYVTVSRELARHLRDDVGVTAARIQTITNGVDTVRFHPRAATDARHAAGQRPGLPPGFVPPGGLCIGTVGRTQAVKDQLLLLRALATLLRERPPLRERVRLAIVGDGPMLPSLRAAAVELGVADVTWMPGASDRVPDLLRAFDVFALPSLNEGISNGILEAMATGLPVLATRVGGNPELVDDGVTGLLFGVGDADALAAAMARCHDEPQWRGQRADAARAAAVERFSLDAMVAKYQTLYRSLALPAS